MKNIVKNIDREMGIIIALVLVVVLLYFVNFQLSINLYQNSLPISNMNNQITQLKLDNNQLYLIYLGKTSYREISSEAATMGFVKAVFVTP